MNKIILVVLFCALLGSIAQICLKKSAGIIDIKQTSSIIGNYWLIIGLFLYGLAMVGYVLSLKHGELGALYSVLAFSYLFVVILSWKFLNEPISSLKILGSLGIIISVGLINYG